MNGIGDLINEGIEKVSAYELLKMASRQNRELRFSHDQYYRRPSNPLISVSVDCGLNRVYRF